MSLLSLIAVFLIEQFRPLNYARVVAQPLAGWGQFIASRFNAGAYRHGVAAWCVAVLLPLVVLAALHVALSLISAWLAWGVTVVLLYLTMGFRQFSHHFTEIQVALRLGDLERARRVLAAWQQQPLAATGSQLTSEAIARRAIEIALLAAHRHVFAVLFWFVILPGPLGAVLYRLALSIRDTWRIEAGVSGKLAEPTFAEGSFAAFSEQAFAWIDWLPARATAIAFAIVGDFEDAIFCWRAQADSVGEAEAGIVLAGGAGALGVQLHPDTLAGAETSGHAELGTGDPADVHAMQRAVGLVWRATILWMVLLFLLGLASLVG